MEQQTANTVRAAAVMQPPVTTIEYYYANYKNFTKQKPSRILLMLGKNTRHRISENEAEELENFAEPEHLRRAKGFDDVDDDYPFDAPVIFVEIPYEAAQEWLDQQGRD